MEFRDYISVIRRRYYIFIPVFLAVVGAHVVWVTSIQKKTYEANAQLAVMHTNAQSRASESFSPVVWLRNITPEAVKAAIENRNIQKKISDLLWGREQFTLPDFTMPPLRNRVDGYLASFQADYQDQESFTAEIPDLIKIDVEPDRSVLSLSSKAKSPENALIVAWAATEGIVTYFNSRMGKELDHIQLMLESEAGNIKSKLGDAEEKWKTVVEEVGFDPIARQERIKGEITTLQGDIDRLSANQRELARRYKELVQARPMEEGNLRSLQAEEVLAQNERVQGLEKRIVELKLERDEMLEVRTQEHPEVVAIEKRIQVLEQRFPQIIKEELAKSLVKLNDRKLNEILYKSRKLALDRELKHEQLLAMQDKLQSLMGKVTVFYPVKENFDRVRDEYRRVLANKINLKLAEATRSYLGSVRVLEPGQTAIELPLKGTEAGPVILSILLALICAVSLSYLVEYVDVKVKNESDIKRYLNLPLLGVIPQTTRNQLTQINIDGHEVAERFNTAVTLLRSTARELDMKTFAVCSAISKEGKTTVAVNVAAALARKGSQVALVDGDLRAPSVHKVLGLNNAYGLSTILSGWISPKQVIDGVMNKENQEGRAVSVTDALQTTTVPGLNVLTSGPQVAGPAKLIESDLFPQVFRQLTESHDYVIFDTPPIDRVSDGLTIASMVDGCVFVVGAGQCEHHEISWAKHLLMNVQANMLGVFLNRYSYGKSREYGYYKNIDRKKVAVS